jgi:hypothetical protein
MGTGAVVLAGLVLTLVAPKAAHAIAATAVLVENAAANPAIAQDVSKLASQNILLWNASGEIIPHSSASLYQIFPNGTTAGSAFVVPAGQTFLATTVDYSPYGVGTIATTIGPEFVTLNAATYTTVQYQFPSGIVFPAGSSVGINNYGISAEALEYVFVHGYLTSN